MGIWIRNAPAFVWLAIGLPLALAGCASAGGALPIPASGVTPPGAAAAPQPVPATNTDPGVFSRVLQAVGLKAAPQPTTLQLPLRIYTAGNVNAGDEPDGIALVLKTYLLRTLDAFERAPFNDFLDDRKARADLGSALIDSRETLLLPGKHYLSTEQLPPDVRYIGFVALFRGPAARRWRFAYDARTSAAGGVTLGLHGCAMSSTEGDLVLPRLEHPDSLAGVRCPKLEE